MHNNLFNREKGGNITSWGTEVEEGYHGEVNIVDTTIKLFKPFKNSILMYIKFLLCKTKSTLIYINKIFFFQLHNNIA